MTEETRPMAPLPMFAKTMRERSCTGCRHWKLDDIKRRCAVINTGGELLETDAAFGCNLFAPAAIACSYCDKTREEVAMLIAGPGGVHICDECIGLCNDILNEAGFSETERKDGET